MKKVSRNDNEHTGNKIEQAALFLSYVNNKTSVATHVRLFNKTRKLMVMEEPECRGVIETRINVHSNTGTQNFANALVGVHESHTLH
ncbi:MAG: hypothetical protein GY820_09960 [Gammaproteobacteria bacterium]|nr:hypothetical protein [Gammaproteobacteria bacterium]